MTIFSAHTKVVRDEPLAVVATVVRHLVPGRGLALGGASVAAVTSLVNQAAHRSEGEGTAVAKLNPSAKVGLVESSELHVGAGQDVGIAKCVLEGIEISRESSRIGKCSQGNVYFGLLDNYLD